MAEVQKGLSAGRLALLGAGVLVIGLALAGAASVMLPDRDPAEQAMVAGVIFIAGAAVGFWLIVAAIVRCFRRSC